MSDNKKISLVLKVYTQLDVSFTGCLLDHRFLTYENKMPMSLVGSLCKQCRMVDKC